ncbi:hypothetical protein RI367_005959 [Sorochytrium milnesiophthora]
MPSAQLGFVEAVDEPLSIVTFPSKVGGKPLWLNPAKIPDAARLGCGVCKEPMSLLMYTPEDFPEDAYHRYVYVFVCRKGSCHNQDWRSCVKAIRCQMGIDNEFYDTDPDTEDTCFKSITPVLAATCAICGLHGTKRCGACSQAVYCSRAHQTLHWTKGLHKPICALLAANTPADDAQLLQLRQQDKEFTARLWSASRSASAPAATFLESELVSEREDRRVLKSSGDAAALADAALVKQYAPKLAKSGTKQSEKVEEDEDADCEESKTGVDNAFLAFQTRISAYPKQVLRYTRISYGHDKHDSNDSDGGTSSDDESDAETSASATNRDILFLSDYDRPASADIPPCPHCHAPRSFEFQILPTMLNHLGVDHADKDALDFGTYLIYSCPDCCSLPEAVTYADEVVYRQQFSTDSMESMRKHQPPPTQRREE